MSDEVDHLDKLKEKVKEYCERYRHPDMENYSFGPIYDLFPNKPRGSVEHGMQWDEEWFNADGPGVYAILDSKGYILYIGKASMNSTLGRRFWDYFGYDSDRNCKLYNRFEDSCARYIWTVSVSYETRFEAPALEEFLLMELKTKLNKQGT